MEQRNHWFKIDNAGKVFPAVSNDNRSSTFRLSFDLKKDIDPVILEEVVNYLLPRFDTFNVKIKHGLFWDYLAANNNYFKVEEENNIIGQYRLKSPSLYCIRVLYYQKRITLETFHSLSDGTGAMEFLKSIVFEYLNRIGENIDAENKIVSSKVINEYEKVDGFNYNYEKDNKLNLKEEKAYQLKGEVYPNYFNLFVKAIFSCSSFIELCHKKGVTATQYVVSLLIYSIYLNQPNCLKSKKPIKIFVPVNLRKYFEVNTLRNFSLYIKVTVDSYNKKLEFDDILELTKKQFLEQLNKEHLSKRMNANVGIEKNFFIRILPSFIKNIGFKIGYSMLGDSVSTSYVSNLGKIDLPSSMYDYINNVDFVNAGENLYLTMVSLQDKMNLIFSSRLIDKSIIYKIIKMLQNEGLDITIQTNYMGEE